MSLIFSSIYSRSNPGSDNLFAAHFRTFTQARGRETDKSDRDRWDYSLLGQCFSKGIQLMKILFICMFNLVGQGRKT